MYKNVEKISSKAIWLYIWKNDRMPSLAYLTILLFLNKPKNLIAILMSILSLDGTLIRETQVSELDKDQGKTNTND